MFSFTRERSDRTGCGRRQGSPLRSDRSRGKALTAVLADPNNPTIRVNGNKEN
jgi:hypothetical protein